MSASNAISEQLKKQLVKLAPEGYDAELARLMIVAAQIQPLTELSDEDKAVVALATEQGIMAGGPDPITDGKPTLMRVVAWMVHEGVNRNGDAFVKEELAVAASKVTQRNPLVMDWDHAAIVGGEGKVIGVWSKLDYAFDKSAKEGAGAWGLMAEGVMFAWCFPEIANTMLAEQERNGKIDFSMACIPSSVEFAQVEGRRAAILHNPVFFTLSALDVPPGDQDATGLAVEGDNSDSVEQQLRQQLTAAEQPVVVEVVQPVATVTAAAGATQRFEFVFKNLPQPGPAPVSTATMRTAKMQPTIAFTVNRKADGQYEITAIAKNDEGELASATYELTVEGVVKAEEFAAATAKITELSGRISEQETLLEASRLSHGEVVAALEALKAEKETVEATLTAQSTELEAAKARLAEVDAAKAEAERVALFATRFKQLPEVYREAHGKREEVKRAELELEWSKMSDETWAAKLEDISLALPQGGVKTASYLERSQREGVLPVAAATAGDKSIAERCQQFTRQSR